MLHFLKKMMNTAELRLLSLSLAIAGLASLPAFALEAAGVTATAQTELLPAGFAEKSTVVTE